MKTKMMKRLFAPLLAVVLVIAGSINAPGNTQAASADVVKFQTVDYSTFKTSIETKTAPACTLGSESAGYLFGGWYTVDGDAIRTLNDVAENTTVTAKFVPAHLTGVSCQIGVDAEGATKTNMRIISLVDSTNYEAVGFNVYGRDDLNDDGVVDEWLMYKYSSDSANPNKAQSTKVYSGLQVYKLNENNEKVEDYVTYPENVFGADAKGFKFTTMNLTKIPSVSYSTIIAIKPYWITLDGTVVEGMGEFDRVQDGIDDIVNISVNIKDVTDANGIAAGMLDVTYGTGNFTYVGADGGRVFEEMAFNEKDGVISCVGNVSSVSANSSKPNEVYANFRFKKTAENKLAIGEAEFTVSILEDSFCDIEEAFVTSLSVWDVKY